MAVVSPGGSELIPKSLPKDADQPVPLKGDAESDYRQSLVHR